MAHSAHALPNDAEALKRLVLAREADLARAQADLVQSRAGDQRRSGDRASAACDREDAPRTLWPAQRARVRLLDQMELQLEELEAASEDEFAAQRSAAGTTVQSFARRRPFRKPFPEHLPRERIFVPGPSACACCGSTRLAKLGEDITETLEVVPRQGRCCNTSGRSSPAGRARASHRRQPLPRAAARLRRPEPARHGAVREVRPAPALEPAGGALCP